MERFSEDHEYIRVEGEVGTVGAQVSKGDEIGVIESVKAASEIYSPVSGEIVEVNGELGDNPSKVNEDAEGAAWLFKIKLSDAGELESLMDAAAYKDLIS